MQIKKVVSEKLKREYDVTVPAKDINEKMEKKLAEIGKKMKVPGFRPGKAPIALVKKNYGGQVLGEIIEGIIGATSQEALKKENLRPALRPKFEIIDYKDDGDLIYKMKFEIVPDMPDINFEKFKLEKMIAEPTETEINEGLGRLTARHKDFMKADKKAAKDDAVLIHFKGFIDGEPFPGGEADDFQLVLGSGQFIPGFEDQLIGAKAGEDKKVNVSFPKDYHSKQFAGKPAIFEVKVKEVQEAKEAKIDDALAKKFGFENLDKLKEAVKKQVESDFSAITRTLVKKELFDTLEKKCDFNVPQEMLELEFESIWKQAESAKKDDPEFTKKAEEKLKKEYKKMAERRVKLGIFLAELGKKNEITVSNQELSAAVMERAKEFPGSEHKVIEFFSKNAGALDELKGPIIEEKMVDFILEKTMVKDKKITPKELLAAAEKLQADAEMLYGASGLAHADAAHDEAGHVHDENYNHGDEGENEEYDDGHHVHGPGCNH